MASADVVVVTYNSRDRIRACARSALEAGANVIIVDNASPDHSLEAVADLPVTSIQLEANYGFAYGCNRGWEAGSSPYVLFLNPDAALDPGALPALVSVLEQDRTVAIVGPRILESDGSLEWSQRRNPRLRSTFARAFFLHHVTPEATWVDEIVREPEIYARPNEPEWASGACLLVRRSVLEAVGGLDERYFMFSEDADLCRTVVGMGWHIRFEPTALVRHVGGASAPRTAMLPTLAESRIRYMRKHRGRFAEAAERLGLAIEALLRVAVTRGGAAARRGHIETLRAVAGLRNPYPTG